MSFVGRYFFYSYCCVCSDRQQQQQQQQQQPGQQENGMIIGLLMDHLPKCGRPCQRSNDSQTKKCFRKKYEKSGQKQKCIFKPQKVNIISFYVSLLASNN